MPSPAASAVVTVADPACLLRVVFITIRVCKIGGMATTMVPPTSALPDVLPTERLNARGMPVPAIRDHLRRIPNVRNALTLAGALAQTFGLMAVADRRRPVVDVADRLRPDGRGDMRCSTSSPTRRPTGCCSPTGRLNDFAGRWLLGYPTFQAFGAYRRVHFAHHRDELGPDEPDTDLYRGYPIPADSWRRKLRRDLTGESAYKNLKAFAACRAGAGYARRARSSPSKWCCSPSRVLLGEPLAYSCGSARGRRCGSSPTACGRSPSTAGWSDPATAGARRT